jgi:nitroimidazol reductase NimA-like FMN-containing flavoprotein (pyridoxamine 5'-phosphate oxidase superfamily)
MPKDYTTIPANQLRRPDRAVNEDAWITDLLRRAPVAVLATASDGQPFVNSNLFVYDAETDAIFMHTARTGRTPHNVGEEERVCLTVFEMGRLLPHTIAMEFSVEYSGVVVFGRASIVHGDEAERGLQLLLDKYFPHLKPGRDYQPIIPPELKRTSVYKIAIDSWSGKRKQAAEDFPGAFWYGEKGDPAAKSAEEIS